MTRNPTRIGRYDLVSALATGGMGRIYLGRASGIGGFDRKVVIKTLEVPLTAESDPAIAMFLDEARLLGLLHHQHIASVFEVGRDEDGRHYMVIDYLEGHSAHDVWERAVQFGSPLPLDFTLTVASATANGLHYAHTKKDTDGTPLGIVHRDVTPSNVMIGFDGGVQLIDFGIAMAANRKHKTETGFVKGKVGYLSPEQVGGRDVDARTDVFALGILLYELSTLHRAFRDSSDLATMQRIKAGRVTRPSLLVPNYPLELEIIVMKALQVDPRERFADADALRRALEALGHRLHLVLGDAAIIEVMVQLYDSRDPGAGSQSLDPAFEWSDSDHDLTVRRDPDELLAMLRSESAKAPRKGAGGAADAQRPARPRRIRAATEAVDLLVARSEPPILPLTAPPETPLGLPKPTEFALAQTVAAAPVEPLVMTGSRPFGASMVEARSARRLPLRWIAGGAGLFVLLLILYLATRSSTPAVASSPQSPAPPVAPAAARTPVPQPAAPPSPVKPPPAPPAPPTKVRVQINTRPAEATVLLDNKKLGRTPIDETIMAEPGKHVLKFKRRGYAPQKLDVALDADVNVDLVLTPQK